MNRKNLILSAVISVIFYSLYGCNPAESGKKVQADTVAVRDSLIKRGGYLVAIVGCQECHSPKNMTADGLKIDPARDLSGYISSNPVVIPHVEKAPVVATGDLTAFYGPWGATFSANITSDTATGIGKWSEARFRKAFTGGKHMGLDKERDVLPPMQKFNNMKDEDIKAIFAYLKSTKPVRNMVPAWISPGKK